MTNSVSEFSRHADWSSDSALLRTLGHPVRLQIVAGLLSGSCNVGQIWQCLCLPQPVVSQHLKTLRDEGIVVANRSGKEIVYEVVDWRVPRVLKALGVDIEACGVILRQDQAESASAGKS